MALTYRPRTARTVLLRALRAFPAVVLSGPRQSGKTTLVRRELAGTHRYCALDEPDVRAMAADDPVLLLRRFPPPVIFDEIQYAPQLLHVVKADIDRHRDEAGRFVLTGSQGFPLMRGITESLAGRAAILTLQSFSMVEQLGAAGGDEGGLSSWQAVLDTASRPGGDLNARLEAVRRGGFPEIALAPDRDARLWHGSYFQTYLERDVRSLRAVGDLGDFQRFVFALAARSGSLLSFADLARDIGVTAKTCKAWASVLETSGQILTVRPYHTNLGKRLVKRPKLYFLDTGLLAWLLNVTGSEQLVRGMAAGAIFETAVLGQLHRLLVHRGEVSRIYFWRTVGGHEVDFVIEDGMGLRPIEARLTATPDRRAARGIERLRATFGPRLGKGIVACLCDERHPLTASTDAVPLGAF